jgi:hypothetical protein
MASPQMQTPMELQIRGLGWDEVRAVPSGRILARGFMRRKQSWVMVHWEPARVWRWSFCGTAAGCRVEMPSSEDGGKEELMDERERYLERPESMAEVVKKKTAHACRIWPDIHMHRKAPSFPVMRQPIPRSTSWKEKRHHVVSKQMPRQN